MTIYMWGGNAPSSYQSGDGSWFTACSHPSDRARFVVYKEAPGAAPVEVDLGGRFEGQGMLCLQANGDLYAVMGETAGTARVRRVLVPGWVRPGSLNVAGAWLGPLGPQHEGDGLMHTRITQIREVLKRNGFT